MNQIAMFEAVPDVAPKTKVHLSWSDNQDEILRTIMTIYNEGLPFECDPMYNVGTFYKNLPEPRWKYDLMPTAPGCERGDATDLPLDDDSVRSVILDPPFLVGNSKTGVMRDRYTKIPTMDALQELYFGIIKEAYRVLMPKSILVMKYQICVSSGSKYPIHHTALSYALEAGFTFVDETPLIRYTPMSQEHTTRGGQQHTKAADPRYMTARKGKLSARERKERALLTLSAGGRNAQES